MRTWVALVLAVLLLSGCGGAKPQSAAVTARPAAATSETTADRVYIDAVTQYSQQAAGSMQRFSELAANPRLLDSTWKRDVAVVLSIWKGLHGQASRLSPPARFRTFHAPFLAAMAKLDDAADDLADGIDRVDVSLIDRATGKVIDANALIRQATSLIPK